MKKQNGPTAPKTGGPVLRDRIEERAAQLLLSDGNYFSHERLLAKTFRRGEYRRYCDAMHKEIDSIANEAKGHYFSELTRWAWLQYEPEDVSFLFDDADIVEAFSVWRVREFLRTLYHDKHEAEESFPRLWAAASQKSTNEAREEELHFKNDTIDTALKAAFNIDRENYETKMNRSLPLSLYNVAVNLLIKSDLIAENWAFDKRKTGKPRAETKAIFAREVFKAPLLSGSVKMFEPKRHDEDADSVHDPQGSRTKPNYHVFSRLAEQIKTHSKS